MKLQLQLQYNSVQNDKKRLTKPQSLSSALDESHNISIFIFHYHGYRQYSILRHPLHAAHVSFHICGIHYVIYL